MEKKEKSNSLVLHYESIVIGYIFSSCEGGHRGSDYEAHQLPPCFNANPRLGHSQRVLGHPLEALISRFITKSGS
ncbi:hypothetical protein Patl1_05293 [Pistacia atlantica]|uniref:Uncharacterized protein n=1 Tax=Pistacia atlantica TaxID=434234 RepID=A0ACC1BTZ7_9ROSI|nr:hypothetical protein Patl1_05293 [Pistacia atlantica]